MEDVAPRLLGLRLRTESPAGPTEVLITEVEAYAGGRDPASHAYRGRTPRNASMFGPSGVLYVYRSYGVHWCMNIVIGGENDPSAVLLRAGKPLVGADIMARRRGRPDHVADGPGKLTQALGVDGDMNGTSIIDGPVRLLDHIVVVPVAWNVPAVDLLPEHVILVDRLGLAEQEIPVRKSLDHVGDAAEEREVHVPPNIAVGIEHHGL